MCVDARAHVCVCVCVCDIVYNYQQKVCFFRWDLEDVDQLPKYMFVYLNSFKTVIIEIEEQLLGREGFTTSITWWNQYVLFLLLLVVCPFLLYMAKKLNDK